MYDYDTLHDKVFNYATYSTLLFYYTHWLVHISYKHYNVLNNTVDNIHMYLKPFSNFTLSFSCNVVSTFLGDQPETVSVHCFRLGIKYLCTLLHVERSQWLAIGLH